MAGDWIKVEHWTPDKPEVYQIAELLSIDPDAVTGKLMRIWIWADQQTLNGDAHSVTRASLDRLAGVTGFAQAMVDASWLVAVEGGFRFTNFERHNGETAKKRALTAKRNAALRGRRHESDAVSVTPPSRSASPKEEKRREENINKETPTPLDKPQLDQPALPGAAASPLGSDKPKRSRPRKPVDPIMIPDALASHPGFLEQWAAWEQHRRELKKTLTASTRNSQLLMLSRHGPAKAVEMLSRSITNGWTGLFPSDDAGGHRGPRRASNESAEYRGAKPLPESEQKVPY